ncbi:winged helix-turn-helix transcriptional regulator [Nocardioides sp. T2.26MG-1]|uniref:winged helix-turn-helix transcriptional regulator n=1 Tax=Nocardioides sp. T2.26MG-1 TaxID=3041166 RepID=UPI0024772EDF|nr:helix-turn-helix domain-containing protein [Nocardioides sp. T2.26MG-1]CAI9399552.1 hypothetical protein HIDPHFAB_00219 [Nocardioides sp. T2.26MG-1]
MATYGQFCPVAKTAELLCERWMPLVLRELMCGSSRFSDIQRGVPLISPTLLAKRLRQLVSAGVAERAEGGGYRLTAAGWELYPLIEAMGVWGQRWVRSDYAPDELDPTFLMWDMRRMLRAGGLADTRTVIEFWIRDAPPRRTTYWLVVDQDIDLCLVDPGQQVDLRVNADLRALTEVWMGDRTMSEARADGSIEVIGPPVLSRRFPEWLGRHPVLGDIGRARG